MDFIQGHLCIAIYMKYLYMYKYTYHKIYYIYMCVHTHTHTHMVYFKANSGQVFFNLKKRTFTFPYEIFLKYLIHPKNVCFWL